MRFSRRAEHSFRSGSVIASSRPGGPISPEQQSARIIEKSNEFRSVAAATPPLQNVLKRSSPSTAGFAIPLLEEHWAMLHSAAANAAREIERFIAEEVCRGFRAERE
jgi:hypothetical protein